MGLFYIGILLFICWFTYCQIIEDRKPKIFTYDLVSSPATPNAFIKIE